MIAYISTSCKNKTREELKNDSDELSSYAKDLGADDFRFKCCMVREGGDSKMLRTSVSKMIECDIAVFGEGYEEDENALKEMQIAKIFGMPCFVYEVVK